jgi:hypothetical protein
VEYLIPEQEFLNPNRTVISEKFVLIFSSTCSYFSASNFEHFGIKRRDFELNMPQFLKILHANGQRMHAAFRSIYLRP